MEGMILQNNYRDRVVPTWAVAAVVRRQVTVMEFPLKKPHWLWRLFGRWK